MWAGRGSAELFWPGICRDGPEQAGPSLAVSPYLKSLAMVTANKLLHLLEAFSTTWFLFSASQNHHLVFFLLEVFNNIIQYQFDGEALAGAPVQGSPSPGILPLLSTCSIPGYREMQWGNQRRYASPLLELTVGHTITEGGFRLTG